MVVVVVMIFNYAAAEIDDDDSDASNVDFERNNLLSFAATEHGCLPPVNKSSRH